MLEVEIKFPAPEVSGLRANLDARGIAAAPSGVETDRYFNAPDRDFARTDEALRVRSKGEETVITYKGPKLDPETKTRTEIEVPLVNLRDAADRAAGLLVQLGYRPVATIRKRRTIYRTQSLGFAVEICVDEVDGLGSYVELEVMALESQMDAARHAVQELARQLGLAGPTRRSYLELWLEKHQASEHAP